MRNAILGSIGMLGLAATIFLATGTPNDTWICLTDKATVDGEITDQAPSPVPPGTLRAAQLPGTTDPEDIADKCPGGAVRVKIPPGQKRDMLVCDVETEDDSGIWTTEVRYLPSGTLPKKCKLVCRDLLFPGLSMANVETGVEACLREVCAPCVISGGSWGHCPHCLTDRTPSCAEACPAPEEIEL